jgi:hypothetical protein
MGVSRRKRQISLRGKPVAGSREAQTHWMASSSTPSGGTSVRRVLMRHCSRSVFARLVASSGPGEGRQSRGD